MNLSPVIRRLREQDFSKILAACKSWKEQRPYVYARRDPEFEFHVEINPRPEPMETWLHNEKVFPDGD